MNTQQIPKPFRTAALAAAVFALTACGGGGGGGGGGGNEPVPLDDPNAVMGALTDKVTSGGSSVQIVTGTPPAPTTEDPDTPKAEAGIAQSTAIPGDSVSLPVNVSGGQQLTNLFAKIPGASSYFDAALVPSGGKSMVRLQKAGAKQGTSFTAVQVIDFRIDLPSNLATGDQICFDFAVKTSANQVSEPTQACITIADQRPAQPANDQPDAASLESALAGNWIGEECFDIEDTDTDGDGVNDLRAVRIGLGFGSGSTYSEFVEFFGTDNCSDAGEAFQFIDGVYSAGAAEYNQQTGVWQRPFDFNPNDPDPSVDFLPCYNLLRLEGGNTLFLGIPLTFQFDDGTGANPQEGDCKSPDTRPTSVITSLPFVR